MESASALLPLDFVAVLAGADVAHFTRGQALAAPGAGARLVLHAAMHGERLRAWEATGALCVPADRLLALLAPDEPTDGFTGALDLGTRYVRAAARLTAHGETLRSAAEVLPAADAAIRSLLHRTLANLALSSLSVRPRAAVDAAPVAAPGPEADSKHPVFDWPDLGPHALLDRAFDHLHAWQRALADLPFEPRTGQAEMAHAVLDALLEGGSVVVEAGTGVGKTIAYVLPALLVAATHGGRFLFSTHTRNLQHQLVARDLPELWRCFGLDRVRRPDGEGQGLRFAKLLGRGNYLCRTALARAARAAAADAGSFELAQALVWSLRSASGELEEIAPSLPGPVLRELASRRESCQGRACRGELVCPVYAARDAARHADLVVANHALLFSDAASEGSILGRFDGVVLDEAHHLEAVATEHLSIRIGRPQADALVAPLGRLLVETRALAHGGGFALRIERYGQRIAALRGALQHLLGRLDAGLPAVAGRRARQAYQDGALVFGPVEAELADLAAALETAVREGVDLESECATDGSDPGMGEVASCLELLVALQRETRAALEFVSAANNEDWAFYLDLGADGGTLREIAAAPLDVAADVQRLVAATARSAVYTSATLAVGGDFEYFLRRVGLPNSAPCLVVPSPFDYPAQCLVVQASHLPDWSAPDYEARVGEILAAIAARTGRRMLVLLTSHASLRRLHAELLRRMGPRAALLAQDLGGSRERLAARFAATPGAMLLGTASFWEGVDFPGRALEVLVIAKLPFLVPDEPLVAARSERLRRHGDDPFMDYMLPEAVLRFKQGFGRLVRTRQDRGVVLLLDPRLRERGYGAAFRRALPVACEPCDDSAVLVERVVGWLETHGPG